jgi:hypothetical protein
MQTLYCVAFSFHVSQYCMFFLTGISRRREWMLDGVPFITTWTAGHYLQYLDSHGLLLPPLTLPNGSSETAVTDDDAAVADPLSVDNNAGSAATPPAKRKNSLLGRFLRSRPHTFNLSPLPLNS